MRGARGMVVVGLGVVCAAILVVSVARGQEQRFNGVTLRVATWGGSWRDAIHEYIGKELEARGAKIEYVIGNPLDNLAKLIAARGRDVPFDVMEIGDGVKPQLLEGEFLEGLDFTRVPNSHDLEENQKDRHTVATVLSQEGIVYNTKKFEEQGIPRPERLKDLFHPRLAGRVAFPDISVGASINGIVGMAIEAGGDETRIEPGLELLKKLAVSSFYRSSVELATKFGSGDVWAAWWTAGWALRVGKSGVPVAMSYPKVGNKEGMLQMVWAGIPKRGKARPAAEFFINRYLDPEVQVNLSRKVGVAPVRRAALTKLSGDPGLAEVMLVSADRIRNMYYIDWSRVNNAEWVNRWNRVMAR